MRYIILSIYWILFSLIGYGQTFDIYDVDASAFPIMKAKFLAFNSLGEQLSNLTIKDFNIREEGNDRKIISVRCNTNMSMDAVSTVLVMDASGSMISRYLPLAKNAARAWINAMPKGEFECAITAFNMTNHLIQDFTSDKILLDKKVDNLFANGGTNYDAALLDEQYGGLAMTRNAKYKKVIVLMTDGVPSFPPNEAEIIQEAKLQGAVIYAVTLGMPCPDVLQRITTMTGGNWFQNVTTNEQAKEIYNEILKTISGVDGCEISWQSDVACSDGIRIADVEFYPLNENRLLSYKMPIGQKPGVSTSSESIFFNNTMPGYYRDTLVTITAHSGNMNVSDIIWDNPAFDIAPRSFMLAKGQSKQLRISFTAPTAGHYHWTRFEVLNSLCRIRFFASGGYVPPKIQNSKLTLDYPNGNEIFIAGSDTNIFWSGIPDNDTVRLEYSTNKGNTWSLISNKAAGGSYKWNRIPPNPSFECLMKATQITSSIKIDPEIAIRNGSDFVNMILDKHTGIKIDRYGYFYVTSHFNGDLFVNNKKYSSEGEEDIYVAKYSPDGKLVWFTQIGGPGSDFASGIAIDNFGNSYISGRFSKFINFDNRTLNSRGGFDALIVKVLPDGTIEWVKNPGGEDYDYANDLCIDAAGNLIVTGAFSKTALIDEKQLVSEGGLDIFVVKYSIDGKILWTKSNGGLYNDEGASVTVDNNNKVVVTGMFSKTAKFDGQILNGFGTNPEFIDYDIFVVKYSITGNIDWISQAGGQGEDYARSIIHDKDNNLYMTGSISQKTKFGNFDLNPKSSGTSNETSDIFIVKMLPDGRFDWGKTAGGKGNDEGIAIALDQFNDPVITGAYFDTAEFGNIKLTGKGFYDVFVAKYSKTGNPVSAKSAGGTSADFGRSIATDSYGNAYVVGTYTGAGLFGKKTLYNELGLNDSFVWGAGGGDTGFQNDISDSLWAIVKPELSAVDIDMGNVFFGAAKDSNITPFVTNISLYDSRIDSIYISGSEKSAFEILSEFSKVPVKSMSGYDAVLRFSPAKLGINRAEIIIHTQSDTIRKNIVGIGLQPDIQLANSIIDFGKVILGEYKDTIKVVTVANKGKSPIRILDITHNNSAFNTINELGAFSLNPDDTIRLDLKFTPSQTGKINGNLEFHYDGFGSPTIVKLSGEGVSPNPSILVSNNYFNDIFCLDNTSSLIDVKNIGGKELIINEVYFEGNNASEFSCSVNLPIILPPFTSKEIKIDYKSEIPGFKSCDLIIKSNSLPDSVKLIPFTLTLSGAKAKFDADIVDFGNLLIQEPSSKIVKVSNIGNKPSYFKISGLNNFDVDRKEFYLIAGQSIGLNFTFSGSAIEGIFEDKIKITDTLCKFETYIDISALVTKEERPIISAIMNDFKPLFCLAENSEILKISNLGKEELIIYEIVIEGNDKNDFVYNFTGSNKIKPGDHTEILVKFKPQSYGKKQAEMIISSNSEIDPELNVHLSAEYYNSEFIIKNNEIDLGKINQNVTKDFEIKIVNNGTIKNTFRLLYNSQIQLNTNEITLNPDQEGTISGIYSAGQTPGSNTEIIRITDTICNNTKNISIQSVVSATGGFTLEMGSAEAYIGEAVIIPVKITNTANLDDLMIHNLSFDLSFNASMLSPNWQDDYNIKNNIGTMGLKNIEFKSKKDGTILVEIPFINGLGNSDVTDLIISKPQIQGDKVNIKTSNGKFKSLGICYDGGARFVNPTGNAGISAISPNPAENGVEITVNMIEQDFGIVTIYDMTGLVVDQFKFEGETGQKIIRINLKDYSSGLYFVRFSTPTINVLKDLMIIK